METVQHHRDREEMCSFLMVLKNRDMSDCLEKFVISDLRALIPKIEEKQKSCAANIVVCGKTSSGKSTVINALTKIELMKKGRTHTTPFNVWIKATDERSSYYCCVEVSGRSESTLLDINSTEGLETFHNLVDKVHHHRKNPDHELNYHSIDVFISKKEVSESSLLSRNVAVLDTPGLWADGFQSDEVSSAALQADVIVLVIDIDRWKEDKVCQELLRDKRFMVKPNALVVFNKCDYLEEESKVRREKIIEEAVKEMTDLLVTTPDLFESESDARAAIHLISAKSAWEELNRGACFNQSFQRFVDKLKSVAKIKEERIWKELKQVKYDVMSKIDDVIGKLEYINTKLNEFISNTSNIEFDFLMVEVSIEKSSVAESLVDEYLTKLEKISSKEIQSALFKDCQMENEPNLRLRFQEMLNDSIPRVTREKWQQLRNGYLSNLSLPDFSSVYSVKIKYLNDKIDEQREFRSRISQWQKEINNKQHTLPFALIEKLENAGRTLVGAETTRAVETTEDADITAESLAQVAGMLGIPAAAGIGTAAAGVGAVAAAPVALGMTIWYSLWKLHCEKEIEKLDKEKEDNERQIKKTIKNTKEEFKIILGNESNSDAEQITTDYISELEKLLTTARRIEESDLEDKKQKWLVNFHMEKMKETKKKWIGFLCNDIVRSNGAVIGNLEGIKQSL